MNGASALDAVVMSFSLAVVGTCAIGDEYGIGEVAGGGDR
jgi:hypothetical protein